MINRIKCLLRGHKWGITFQGTLRPFIWIRYRECFRCGRLFIWRIKAPYSFEVGGKIKKWHWENGRRVIDDLEIFEFSITPQQFHEEYMNDPMVNEDEHLE